jgi:phosphoglycolate phosphatase-like HAD superfamily hydrolase
MPSSIIAVVFDCDDTLCLDTTSALLQIFGINPKDFWEEINEMVKGGWDPPQAYMHRILQYLQEGKIKTLTKKSLQEFGKKLKLFPGLPMMFQELKHFVSRDQNLKKARISLEFYIISGGLEEVIRGTQLAKHVSGIFGCNFAYDPKTDQASAVKSTVSFTEKTRFIFAINKGISEEMARSNPYTVNDAIPETERQIPLKNMIYIGDGPSDIPCLSLITKGGGEGIGVSPPTKTFKKGYEMARGERITVGPYTADYRKGRDMRKALEEIILSKGLEMAFESRRGVVGAPKHE